MSGIFISYRRNDCADDAHRLYQALCKHFGAENVFIDVEDIDLGENFAQVLDEKVGFCDVLIAMIGRSWIDCVNPNGQRRIDDPGDWVRLEIASALSRGIKVIPVLVDGAPLPHSTDLPAPLALLPQAQALDLKKDRFDECISRLTSALKVIRQGTTTAGIWFSIIAHGHYALDPLDLHKPEVLKKALRFMFYMVLLESIIHVPSAVSLTQPLVVIRYLINDTIVSYVQYLGIGFIFHYAMKLCGGQGKLTRSIAAFSLLTAYAPLIAIVQLPIWGINVSALQDAANLTWNPDLVIAKMQAFIQSLGTFGILRIVASFIAATVLWQRYFSAVFQAFRTLHRLPKGRALLAFMLGMIFIVIFIAFVVAPYFGGVAKGLLGLA